MKHVIASLTLLVFQSISCQAFWHGIDTSLHAKLGFEKYLVIDNRDSINIYIYNPDHQRVKKKLFFYIQGSGSEPLCQIDKNGKPGLNFSLHTYAGITDSYYFALVSKPSIPFAVNTEFTPPESFFQNYTLDRYVHRSIKALQFLSKLNYVDNGKTVVAGFSEGADVAAGIASAYKGVDKLVLLSPGGTSTYFDFLINIRKDVANNSITYNEGELKINTLINQIKLISESPNSNKLTWLGHSYRRWASFSNPTVDMLLKVKIPILVVSGSADRNVPIESSDFIRIEFARRRKYNLTCKEYHNCNHLFQDKISVPGQSISKKDLVATDIINWLL